MKQQKGYSSFIEALIILGDFFVVNVVFLACFCCFRESIDFCMGRDIFTLLFAVNLCYVPCAIFIKAIIHERIVFADRIVERVFYNVFLHFVLFFTLLLLLRIEELSRPFLFYFYLLFFASFVVWRLCVRFALKRYRRRGNNYTSIIIVGGGKNGLALAEEMLSDPSYGFRILGFFDDNPAGLPPGIPFLGTTDRVEAFLLSPSNEVDEVYCALPEYAEAKIMRLLSFCENHAMRFNIIPEIRRYVKKKLNLVLLGGIPVLVLRNEPLQNVWNRFLKRTFDVVFSFIFLVTLFPLILLIVSIFIKFESGGSIFFKQLRTGKAGCEFDCYKFRTMIVNEEAHLKQAIKGDSRITRIGAFLRRTNLDEVPQFYNVLRGEMSVVGPRPHMLQHTIEYSELIDKYMVRHLVKPGITGWAQVNGCRGETKTIRQMEERVIRDVWYIENWTLLLDMKIIVRTILNMFKGDDNAY